MSYKRGQNPNSIKALKDKGMHEGRPSAEKVYGEPKQRRTLSVTNTGWDEFVKAIKAQGYSSVSDYIEKVGRGATVVSA